MSSLNLKIPNDWKLVAFEELAVITNGQVDPKIKPYSDMILLGSDHIREGGGGLVPPLTTASVQDAISGKYLFRCGQIVYSKIRPNLNKVYFADFDGLCSADIYPIDFSNSPMSPKFAYYALLGERFYKSAVAASMRSGIPKVNRDDLASIEIVVPPAKVQQRIVAVLDAWDKAIEKTERLIKAQRKRNQALINRQLFGTNSRAAKGLSLTAKRVTGSNSWPLRKIGDFAREVSVFNRQDRQLPVLSCTKHHGLVLSDEYFAGRRIYSDDVSGYKMVERRQFAYATNHLEEGSIGWQSIVDAGLVSPMYTVFDVDDAAIDRKFLITVLKTETYRQVFEINTSSSVDRRGGLRWEEFAALPFALPSLEIQKQLATIVETLESDLASSQAALQSLQKQKRGLMQKLLTGEWQLDERFDVPNADTKGNC